MRNRPPIGLTVVGFQYAVFFPPPPHGNLLHLSVPIKVTVTNTLEVGGAVGFRLLCYMHSFGAGTSFEGAAPVVFAFPTFCSQNPLTMSSDDDPSILFFKQNVVHLTV